MMFLFVDDVIANGVLFFCWCDDCSPLPPRQPTPLQRSKTPRVHLQKLPSVEKYDKDKDNDNDNDKDNDNDNDNDKPRLTGSVYKSCNQLKTGQKSGSR